MPPQPRLAPNEEIDGSRSAPASTGSATGEPGFTRGPAKRPATPPGPPATAAEAEQRYFARYGWQFVEALFGPLPRPETVQQWIGLAEETRDYLTLGKGERLARRLEDLAAAIRRKGE